REDVIFGPNYSWGYRGGILCHTIAPAPVKACSLTGLTVKRANAHGSVEALRLDFNLAGWFIDRCCFSTGEHEQAGQDRKRKYCQQPLGGSVSETVLLILHWFSPFLTSKT